MPLQKFIGLATLEALGVCLWRMLLVGRNEGIGCVPKQNFVRLA